MDARGKGVRSLSLHLSLFDADSEGELVTSIDKAVDQYLECFSVCVARAVSKEGLSDGHVPDFDLGSESGQV